MYNVCGDREKGQVPVQKQNKILTNTKIMAKSDKKEQKAAQKKREIEAQFEQFSIYEPQAYDITIRDMISQLENDGINKADFQREFRWSDKDKSTLIESILLGYAPPCLFAYEEKEDGIWKIKFHDGLQRSNSIWKFVGKLDNLDEKGHYKLKGLETLTFLNGLYFCDLPHSMQQNFLNRKLTIVKYPKGTPKWFIREHFKRLNIKGVPLSIGETFRGSYFSDYYKLVSKLSNDADFCKAIGTKGQGKKKNELANEKMAMYWAALYHDRVWNNGVVNYKNKPEANGGWIEQHMSFFNDHPEAISGELLRETEDAFKKAVKLNKLVMGENPFRKPKVVDGAFEYDENGEISLCNVNNGLFECLMYFMSFADYESVVNNRFKIKDAIFTGMRLAPTVYDAFHKANQNAKSASIRFPFIYDVLTNCGVKFNEISS